MKSFFSIIIPAYCEGESIAKVLDRIQTEVNSDYECLIVVDSIKDPTYRFLVNYSKSNEKFKPLINEFGDGPANAIRFGIERSTSNFVVVTMADGSDDPGDIQKLVNLLERGVVIAAASRYMPGGQQVGAPFMKSVLSRFAGLTLYHLRRVGTRDSTNNFKAYDKNFLVKVGIQSVNGFELGLELVSKAKRLHLPVAEIPTIWIEQADRKSNFKLFKWLPYYIKWYLFTFGVGEFNIERRSV